MEFSRQYLVALASKTNFIKDTLEKVLRLSEVLKFLNTDIVFKGKLALKGGTAINLTAVELPRLSVDIDLDFTENISKDEFCRDNGKRKELWEKYRNKITVPLNTWGAGHAIMRVSDKGVFVDFYGIKSDKVYTYQLR